MLNAKLTKITPIYPDDSTVDLTVLRNFIALLKGKYATAPNCEVALKNLECLMFIKANQDFIRYAVNNWRQDPTIFKNDEDRKHNVLRAHNGMAFHLNDYIDKADGAEKAIADFIETIHQTEVALIDMTDAPETIVKIFIRKFEASDVGCMERRLAPALSFHVRWITSGRKLVELDSILEPIILKQQNDNFAIFCGLASLGEEYVDEEVVYKNRDRKFNWELIKQWLEQTLSFEPEDFKGFHQRFRDGCIYTNVTQKGVNYIRLTVKDTALAEVFYNYVKLLMPEQFKQDFARGRLKTQRDGKKSFMLTPSQLTAIDALVGPAALASQPTAVSVLPVAPVAVAPVAAPVLAATTLPDGAAKIRNSLNAGVRFNTLEPMAQAIAANIVIKTNRQPMAGILDGYYVFAYRSRNSSFDPNFIAFLQAELAKQNLFEVGIEIAQVNNLGTPLPIRIFCPATLIQKFARIVEAYKPGVLNLAASVVAPSVPPAAAAFAAGQPSVVSAISSILLQLQNPGPVAIPLPVAPAAPVAIPVPGAYSVPTAAAVANGALPLPSPLATVATALPSASVVAATPLAPVVAVTPAAAVSPAVANNASAAAATKQVQAPTGPTAATVRALLGSGQRINTKHDQSGQLAQWIGFRTGRPPIGGVLVDHAVFLYRKADYSFEPDFITYLKSGLALELANFALVENVSGSETVQIICHLEEFNKFARLVNCYSNKPKALPANRSALIAELSQHIEQLAKFPAGAVGASMNPQVPLQLEQCNALRILKFWLTHEPETTLSAQLESYRTTYPDNAAAFAKLSAQSPVRKTLEEYLAKEQPQPVAANNAAACVVM